MKRLFAFLMCLLTIPVYAQSDEEFSFEYMDSDYYQEEEVFQHSIERTPLINQEEVFYDEQIYEGEAEVSQYQGEINY